MLLGMERPRFLRSAVHLTELIIAGRAELTASATGRSACGCAHAAKSRRATLNRGLEGRPEHHAGRAVRAMALACVRCRVRIVVAQQP
jgi:hypothetical protein